MGRSLLDRAPHALLAPSTGRRFVHKVGGGPTAVRPRGRRRPPAGLGRRAGSRAALARQSFKTAAVAYIEDFHPPADADNEISIIVRDLADGREQCFHIDLDTGETGPCS